MTEKPIGIFDSGLGGLTVFAAVKERMPNENIIYLGDTARVPYGDKSPDTVLRFGCEDAQFMVEKGVKLIIVACNTVSSLAITGIREFFQKNSINIPIIGVLEAGVEAVISENIANLAVIGTRGTVKSNAYSCELRKKAPSISTRTIACPLFAPIVEEGLADHEIANLAINIYLQDLRSNPPDALLLGCTHYPLITDALKRYLPEGVKIIDSAHAVANLAEKYLSEQNLRNTSNADGQEEFYVTDSTETFAVQAEKFLNRSIKTVNKTAITSLRDNMYKTKTI